MPEYAKIDLESKETLKIIENISKAVQKSIGIKKSNTLYQVLFALSVNLESHRQLMLRICQPQKIKGMESTLADTIEEGKQYATKCVNLFGLEEP
jgi:hypothetical protein